VRLSGRLSSLPRRGVVVSVQARQAGVWRTVDTVETRSDGRCSWPYRFQRGQGGRTFAFRARVKSPNHPFAPGKSRTIAVRVRR
jgi:5-hydroxyisourate hydrolase-like protein (transthyretin family)